MSTHDDGIAPTIPDTSSPTQRAPSASGADVPALDTRYELREILGRGGMGEVWLARDARIDRDVAIKLMRRDGAHDSSAVARFLLEARVQGRLEHPAIVPVHDLAVGPDAPYFAMKRLAGTTLADVLSARASGDRAALDTWTRPKLLARLVDVCLAIELAHTRGVIHRDLKPANIMLGDFGETYVLDWGLARVASAAETAIRANDLPSDPGGGQTVAGAMLGTPGYMPPEQVRGEPVDHRADVYALGCILYEILADEAAVPRTSAIEATLAAVEHRPSLAKRAVAVPPELDDACARATAADRGARTASARTLADAIQRFLDGDRDLVRRRELAASHAARALSAYARGDGGRAEAMREAGVAIALDPACTDAQRVLARLMLEPPREVPAEARARIEADRERAAQVLLRVGALLYAMFLVLVPMFYVLGARRVWPFATLGGLNAAIAVGCFVVSRRPKLFGAHAFVIVVALHSLLLAAFGIVFGPFVVLPPIAVGSLGAILMLPMHISPLLLLAMLASSVAIPVALEWTHVVPSTFEVIGGGLVYHPWAIDTGPYAILAAVVVLVALQLFATTAISAHYRANQDRMHELQHVREWQLRQLLPAAER